MIIHRGYEGLKLVDPVVTMGIFDGVHKGHRMLLDLLVEKAGLTGGEAVVITFHPHPRMILDENNNDLFFLSTIDEKQQLLEASGIDHLVILEFTREFSQIRACDFISAVLVGKMGARHLVVGYDHHFGWNREGELSTIKQCSELYNFKVEQAAGYVSNGVAVSSSGIRNALLSGQVEKANEMLGYHYMITGTVIKGKGIGRSLGFPTANIDPGDPHKLIPSNGVYTASVHLGDEVFRGMLSIGSNPTVNKDAGKRSIEVHIIDFERDIYGEQVTLKLFHRLRDERKFASLSLLTEQMKLDRLAALELFS